MVYGRDEIVAVHLIKSYCLPILFNGCVVWQMLSSEKHRVDVRLNKIFNACLHESAEPLLFIIILYPSRSLSNKSKSYFTRN